MQGPSQDKSQPQPKSNVKLEADGGNLMQLHKGFKCYKDEELRLKEIPPVANQMANGN
jgi:hypothetical protein